MCMLTRAIFQIVRNMPRGDLLPERRCAKQYAEDQNYFDAHAEHEKFPQACPIIRLRERPDRGGDIAAR
jgi:hypothetical protein